jgi:hypothetical protein
VVLDELTIIAGLMPWQAIELARHRALRVGPGEGYAGSCSVAQRALEAALELGV